MLRKYFLYLYCLILTIYLKCEEYMDNYKFLIRHSFPIFYNPFEKMGMLEGLSKEQNKMLWEALEKESKERKSFPLIQKKKFIVDYVLQKIKGMGITDFYYDGEILEYLSPLGNKIQQKI